MTYAAIALALVALGAWAAIAGARRLPQGLSRRRHWLAVTATAALLLALTALFDNLMIAAGLMKYDLTGASGLVIGDAPLEDFSYPLACALAVPGLWLLLVRKDGASDD